MKIRGAKLLVRRYMRPEKVGSIHIPDPSRLDLTRSLWELEATTPAANDALHCDLERDWLLVTPRNSGVYLYTNDPHVEIFLLAATSVLRIIPWTTEKTMNLKGERVLVTPEKEPERRGAIIVATPAWEKRPVTGIVREVGDEVNDADVVVGARVLFGIHAGTDLTLNGAKHLLLEASQVLAVLGDEVVG